jgi:hypothetical protein
VVSSSNDFFVAAILEVGGLQSNNSSVWRTTFGAELLEKIRRVVYEQHCDIINLTIMYQLTVL